MESVGFQAVEVYRRLVDSLLDRAAQVKPDQQIEPSVTEALLGESIWQVPDEQQDTVNQLNQQTQFAAVEIAFREKFYRILVSTLTTDGLDDADKSRHLPPSTSPALFKFGICLTSYRSSRIMVSCTPLHALSL